MTKNTEHSNIYNIIQSMANNKKPYLVMALRQDIAKVYGFSKDQEGTKDQVLIQDLKVIADKLKSNLPFTLKERFIVQYVITQDYLYSMRRDGEEALFLNMDIADKLSTHDLKKIKEEQKQGKYSNVLDMRDRLPKKAMNAGTRGETVASPNASESEMLFSAREFESVLIQFLDLYSQLTEDKQELIRFEAEKVQLMSDYNISEEQLEEIYSNPNAANQSIVRRLQAIDSKRESLVAGIRERIDTIDRFYRDNMTLEDKLKLKAVLEEATLGPAPQLQLQNVLRLGVAPRPGSGGKKPEEQYQPRPRPTTPRPL